MDKQEHHKKRAFTSFLLQSNSSFDVLKGIGLLFELIEDNPSDESLYAEAHNAAKSHPEHLEKIEEKLKSLEHPLANDVLKKIIELHDFDNNNSVQNNPKNPDVGGVSIDELLQNADDKYYAAEYDDAIKLYSAVLEKDSSNKLAHEQIKKAELLRGQERISATLPREAVQFYRRARSYVNAGDVSSAANFLQTALDIADEKGVLYPEAQQLFDSLQDALVASKYKQEADVALKDGEWAAAIEKLQFALNLDKTDKVTKNLLNQLENLLAILHQVSSFESSLYNPDEKQQKYLELRKRVERIESGIAISKLYAEVADHLKILGESLSQEFLVLGEVYFEKAKQASSLQVKVNNYRQSLDYFEAVEEISGTLLVRNSSDEDSTRYISIKGDCENELELATHYRNVISSLKGQGMFPYEGIKSSDIDAWETFAPRDSDIKLAKDAYKEMEQKEHREKLIREKEMRNKRIQMGGILIVVFVLLFSIIGATYPWLSKTVVSLLPPTPTMTLIPSSTPSPTITLTPSMTLTPTITPTETVTPSPTNTPSGIAVAVVGGVAAYVEPSLDSTPIGNIPKSTELAIRESRSVSGIQWYLCTWNINGINYQGWITDSYIVFVVTPIP